MQNNIYIFSLKNSNRLAPTKGFRNRTLISTILEVPSLIASLPLLLRGPLPRIWCKSFSCFLKNLVLPHRNLCASFIHFSTLCEWAHIV